jgi:hypothetical protein
MAYDATKPVTGGSLIAADVRENFRAVIEDGIVEDVVAALKDPIAATAGLRTLGTGAQQALPGNTSFVPADNSVTMEKMEHGSIMLPWYDKIDGTAYSSVATTWETVVSGFRVYIPASATAITMHSRQKVSGDAGLVYARFYLDANYSSENSTTSATYVYLSSATLDVSALSGWYTMGIQLYRTAGGTRTSWLQGFSFIWI